MKRKTIAEAEALLEKLLLSQPDKFKLVDGYWHLASEVDNSSNQETETLDLKEILRSQPDIFEWVDDSVRLRPEIFLGAIKPEGRS